MDCIEPHIALLPQHKGGPTMQTARPLDRPRTWENPSYRASNQEAAENDREHQPMEIKVGKMIFYVTVALGLWFFYWFNGIQCPC